MSQEQFETVQKLLAALNQRDPEGYLACCTHDVELRPATVSVEGAYHGASGVRRFIDDLRATTPDFQVEVERLEAVGQKVLTGTGDGRLSNPLRPRAVLNRCG
jgi:limonene-1,2-epoxide hydrolase